MKIFRNRTVIGVLCILLALIICFGVTPLFSRSASEKTEIVRVTMDIKEGDEITAEMVQTVEVGAYNLPQNLMTDKKEVVGKYATADLAAGDYILSSKLSAVPAAENAYLYNLDGTKQAISVSLVVGVNVWTAQRLKRVLAVFQHRYKLIEGIAQIFLREAHPAFLVPDLGKIHAALEIGNVDLCALMERLHKQ